MPQPILGLDEEVYHFAKRFDALSHTTASATGSPTVAVIDFPKSNMKSKEIMMEDMNMIPIRLGQFQQSVGQEVSGRGSSALSQ